MKVGRQLLEPSQKEEPVRSQSSESSDSEDNSSEYEQIVEQIKSALSERNFDEAVAIVDRYVQHHPKDAFAWRLQGELLNALGRYEQAIESYDQAIALKPDYANAWNNRGVSLKNLGRDEQAIESYDQAIALKPDYANAWNNRGVSLDNLGRDEQAIESYDQAIALKPDDADAWNNRGVSLDNLGRDEQAIESYDQAIALKPDYANAWNNRGVSLKNLGRYEQAIESYDQAIALQPDDANAWGNRGLTAFSVNENVGIGLTSQFVSDVRLSLSRSKRQLLHHWQPPRADSLLQSFSQSPSPSLLQFLQQSPDLAPLQALFRQPIPEALFQWLAQNKQKHPHHTNPDLNMRGYEGALASYKAPLDKAIRRDTHPEGWAKLHQAIGKAHLRESEQRSHPRSLWAKAYESFNTALSAPDLASTSPTLYLQLLESLIDLCITLGEPQTAQELQRQGHGFITRLLSDDSLPTAQRQAFTFAASRFEQLSVDSLVQQGELAEALSTAETGKRICLRWLLQLDEVPPTDLSYFQQYPHQAVLYWHLSHSRLTTFLLLPGDTSPRLIPSSIPADSHPDDDRPSWLQQQLAWEKWLQQWNQDYLNYSRLNKSTPKEHHAWRQTMPQRLNDLSNLLNIDAIKTELSTAQANNTQIDSLLLIPHRDLHRFPLHGLFADYTCRYLPHIPLHPPTSPTAAFRLTPLLIVENPKHQAPIRAKGIKELAALPFAELEAECLRQLISPQPSHTLTESAVTNAQLSTTLAGDYRVLHFSGHGIYDAGVPAQSCLFLSGADRFTLLDIVQQDLSQFDLVTLAACETAITGSESLTDEYVGLVSAFLSAGARTVLSTLWRVESEASMVLIVEFYRNLNQGMTPAAALRQAQSFLAQADRQTLHAWFTDALTLVTDPVMQVLLRERQEAFANPGAEQPFSHPYFWSPFTLTGL